MAYLEAFCNIWVNEFSRCTIISNFICLILAFFQDGYFFSKFLNISLLILEFHFEFHVSSLLRMPQIIWWISEWVSEWISKSKISWFQEIQNFNLRIWIYVVNMNPKPQSTLHICTYPLKLERLLKRPRICHFWYKPLFLYNIPLAGKTFGEAELGC